MTRRSIALLLAACASGAVAQSTSTNPLDPPPNGVRRTDPSHHAFTNATIHAAPGRTIEHAGLVIKDGIVTWIGSLDGQTPVPEGAVLHDASGLHIYPGFIESFIEVDPPETTDGSLVSHWNPMVTPDREAIRGPGLTDSDRTQLRELGFVAAHITPRHGTFRGLSGVVSLAAPSEDPSLGGPVVYRDHVGNVLSFDRTQGKPDGSGYPVSHMGAVALIRQTLLDSKWQRNARDAGMEIPRNTLDAIDPDLPLIFDTDHPLKVLSAGTIAREFDWPAIVIGDGREYQRLDAIADQRLPLVVPLRFPADPDVSGIGAIDALDLAELQAWEQAPTNPARCLERGLTVALTSSKLPKRASFAKHLRRAIASGLSEQDALAALTTTPARLLGIDDRLGTLDVGKIASFIVADGSIFDEDTTILEVWIDGRRHRLHTPTRDDIAGTWSFTFGQDPSHDGTLTISFEDDKPRVTIESNAPGGKEIEARDATLRDNRLSYVIDMPDDGGAITVTVIFQGSRVFGTILTPSGEIFHFTGSRAHAEDEQHPDDDTDKDDGEQDEPIPDRSGRRFGPYAMPEVPPQETALFVNATIWTASERGILDNAWLFIEQGRITALGTGPAPRGRPNTRIIDCEGKHITPGIVDAHSHTGLFALGVNEGSQACTAEVRIHDDLDPGHISWYRQLAAGVTTVNSLHGSANPIGGQNAIHKVRWGAQHPNEMLMQGARPGIKFALGENVKQSNWGDEYTVRYPQTRMGVETFIRDRFLAAREYAQNKDPLRRRDLELDALAEILAGERLIHCHSYRQDEILMLCRIAEEFGFLIGSFQHVLEGYKVAEYIKQYALGASCFSDWWAYKVEVQDAIPYNGPIMHAVGVAVSYNSDSDDLVRRLNTEAAKAVKYGGLDPHEALKFVTINPAIQLGIDDRVGSLEVGKDADLVVWSGNPLSTGSVCERTWIDGREYFSIERDAQMREANDAERRRILAKLLRDDDEKNKDAADDDEGVASESQATPDDPRFAILDRLSLEYLDNLSSPRRDTCAECSDESWLQAIIRQK